MQLLLTIWGRDVGGSLPSTRASSLKRKLSLMRSVIFYSTSLYTREPLDCCTFDDVECSEGCHLQPNSCYMQRFLHGASLLSVRGGSGMSKDMKLGAKSKHLLLAP